MSAETIERPEPTYSSLVAAEVRAAAGRGRLSARQLAATLGMSQQAVSDRWRERTPWTFDDVQRVERALDLVPGTILTEVVRHQGLEPRTRWFGAWASLTRLARRVELAPVVDLAAARTARRAVAA